MSEEIKDIIEAEKEYNASQIQVLEGLEAVRKRPGMYIGSTSASGLHHLVYEIVDNAVDEALAGYCKHVVITINEGNTITVTDDGRGIPVDIQAQTGKPALEVVYTVLHAGGKFGGGGYKVSGGLHGVGASVVNALSEWLEVEVSKDGKIYQMKFSRGHITQEMRVIGTTDQHGTKVTFKPDPEMFDTLEYDYETLHTRMREQAFLNAGLHITIKDERIESADKPEKERKDSMCYEGGIREFVRWYNRHKTPLHEQVIYMSGTKGDDTAEVALQYNDSFASTIVSFANDIHTPEGGMHEEGFKRALTNVLNAYGVKKGYIKGDDKVSGDDVREGLTAIVSVKLTEAQFEGQTKAKLGNASMRTLVSNIVTQQLAEFLEENPAVGKAILDKAMMANRAREAARKAREAIRRKTGLESGQMPDKLRDCNDTDPTLTEIYIVEGDSAGGSATQGRDSRFQAILPLLLCCRISLLIQDFQCPECCHCILLLVCTCQGYRVLLSFIKKNLSCHGCFQNFRIIPVSHLVWYILFLTYSSDHSFCFRLLLHCYHMTVRLDNAGFFLCDFTQGISKKCRMIHTDRYQNGKNCRTDYVGGVQIAAHANFH